MLFLLDKIRGYTSLHPPMSFHFIDPLGSYLLSLDWSDPSLSPFEVDISISAHVHNKMCSVSLDYRIGHQYMREDLFSGSLKELLSFKVQEPWWWKHLRHSTYQSEENTNENST